MSLEFIIIYLAALIIYFIICEVFYYLHTSKKYPRLWKKVKLAPVCMLDEIVYNHHKKDKKYS
jgi:hypothetical protein